jgi:hypothetical protein
VIEFAPSITCRFVTTNPSGETKKPVPWVFGVPFASLLRISTMAGLAFATIFGIGSARREVLKNTSNTRIKEGLKYLAISDITNSLGSIGCSPAGLSLRAILQVFEARYKCGCASEPNSTGCLSDRHEPSLFSIGRLNKALERAELLLP